MNIPKELQELRANIEILTKKYEETKAMPPEEMDKDHNKMEMEDKMRDMMMKMMSYTHSRISYLEDEFYTHAGAGHLPPILGAGKMEECLKTMGLDKDYQVRKPMVTAANIKYNLSI